MINDVTSFKKTCLIMNQSSMYIHTHIYTHKNSDLMQESMKFCHMAHSMKGIETFLNYIRNKNKFKRKNSLFPFVGVKNPIKKQCLVKTIGFMGN